MPVDHVGWMFWVITVMYDHFKKKGGEEMDFLTGMAYWGIILLSIINAIIVLNMDVNIGNK